MQAFRLPWRAALLVAALLCPSLALADHPAPKEADWIAKDFRFHTGEVLPDLRIHYTTIGSPSSEPVLGLHGTTGMPRFCKTQLAEFLAPVPKR